jgi:hypothetical protein
MLTHEEIYHLFKERQKAMFNVHNAAAMLQAIYEGKYVVPLPEIDENEQSGVANLIQTGIDQHAMRIASVMPVPNFPPTKTTNAARKTANQRVLAVKAWWHMNRMPLKLGYRARYLIGQAISPVLIRPGKEGYPVWEIRKPTETFPAPTPPEDLVPEDCIFNFERDANWMRSHYPDYYTTFGIERGKDKNVKILQFYGPDQMALVALDPSGTRPYPLASVPNHCQRPVVVIPGRITMGELQGQFNQLVGMYATQAKLWALQVHAVMREVFGETWAVATAAGGVPEIITEADGYDGTIGKVRDGTVLFNRPASSRGPLEAIDRQERSQRLTGAIPAEMGGESGSNIRTGRRGGQILSATVDFYIQEHQNLLANSLEEENKIAISIAKHYYGDSPKTFYVPIGKGIVSYTPSITFETDSHSVSYAYAGTDTNKLVIEAGQRVAQRTLSKDSFMEIDPMVNDKEAEHDKLIKESIEEAMLQSILQQAAMPDGPWQPDQLGRLMELVYVKDLELWEAVKQIHEEAAAAQAEHAQAQQPGAPPGMEAQPGIAQAGAPGTPQAAIQAPNQSQMNLGQLMATLRQGGRGAVPVGAPPPGANA